jgi:transcriptional regulator with XRE-family HTH domain
MPSAVAGLAIVHACDEAAVTDAAPVGRRLLGAALRRSREQAGYSLDDAARILGCNLSRISRIETGQRAARTGEVLELLTAYGVLAAQRDALVALARQAHQPGWWQSYGHALCEAYQDYLSLETSALTIQAYEPQLVPGLLQTEDYARAVAEASLLTDNRAEQEEFVHARMARQQALRREPPVRLWAIVSEAALRQLVGGAAVMRAQLEHLLEVGDDLPHVSLQVLPFAAGAHAAPGGPFAVLRFAEVPELGVVYAEGLAGGVYLESVSEVGRYALAFEHLRAGALPVSATTRLIHEAVRAL